MMFTTVGDVRIAYMRQYSSGTRWERPLTLITTSTDGDADMVTVLKSATVKIAGLDGK